MAVLGTILIGIGVAHKLSGIANNIAAIVQREQIKDQLSEMQDQLSELQNLGVNILNSVDDLSLKIDQQFLQGAIDLASSARSNLQRYEDAVAAGDDDADVWRNNAIEAADNAIIEAKGKFDLVQAQNANEEAVDLNDAQGKIASWGMLVYVAAVRMEVAAALEDGAFAQPKLKQDLEDVRDRLVEIAESFDEMYNENLDLTLVDRNIFGREIWRGTSQVTSGIDSDFGFTGGFFTRDASNYKDDIFEPWSSANAEARAAARAAAQSYIDQNRQAVIDHNLEILGYDIVMAQADLITEIVDGQYLSGDAGEDVLTGGGGDDLLEGAAGADSLDGGEGDDVLRGGLGADKLEGGAGIDTLRGGDGDDKRIFNADGSLALDGGLYGGDDRDILKGDGGDDDLFGQAGDDTLYGGDGDDFLSGNNGDDVLSGDDGNDELRGGGGADDVRGGFGDDVIRGNSGDDVLAGDDGDDSLFGGGGADVIEGGGGDDFLSGVTGDDILFGDSGDDRLFGKANDDTLFGGLGRDTLTGNAGDDVLDGGAGRDVLVGGPGDDILTGGEDIDRFVFRAERGADTITDFEVGTDFIIFRDRFIGPREATFDDLEIFDAADAAVVRERGLEIVLEGVLASSLSEDAFIF